jgi:hypothetical protein
VVPLLPAGMNHDQAMSIYQLCAAEGLVTQRDAMKTAYAERTFAIAPTMETILDELLYEDNGFSGLTDIRRK